MNILERPSFQLEVHERFPEIPWLTPAPVICPKCGTELTDATRLPRRKRGHKGDCRTCHERMKAGRPSGADAGEPTHDA